MNAKINNDDLLVSIYNNSNKKILMDKELCYGLYFKFTDKNNQNIPIPFKDGQNVYGGNFEKEFVWLSPGETLCKTFDLNSSYKSLILVNSDTEFSGYVTTVKFPAKESIQKIDVYYDRRVNFPMTLFFNKDMSFFYTPELNCHVQLELK